MLLLTIAAVYLTLSIWSMHYLYTVALVGILNIYIVVYLQFCGLGILLYSTNNILYPSSSSPFSLKDAAKSFAWPILIFAPRLFGSIVFTNTGFRALPYPILPPNRTFPSSPSLSDDPDPPLIDPTSASPIEPNPPTRRRSARLLRE